HARAETFVIARRLARILKRRMVSRIMPARALFLRKLRRKHHATAATAARRSCVSCFIAGHSSSLFVDPQAGLAPGIFSLLVSHSHCLFARCPDPRKNACIPKSIHEWR